MCMLPPAEFKHLLKLCVLCVLCRCICPFPPGAARRQHGQRQHQVEVVVGGDTIEALEAAAQAAVDDHVLAAQPLERPDRRHQRAAGARAIPGARPVHVARVETERTVVAVVAATGQRPDEAVAVTAGEAIVGCVAAAALRVARGDLLGRHAGPTRCPSAAIAAAPGPPAMLPRVMALGPVLPLALYR